MNMKRTDFQQYRQAVVGFCAGVILTLVVFAATKGVVFPGAGSDSGKIVAEVAGEKLTEGKLQEIIGASLIPLETDRYAVYSRAVDKWINEKLFAKEAKALGISLQDLYFKKIWDQVRVSSGDVAEYYSNNKDLYNQPLEKIREPLLKQLRDREYSRVEQKYLEELKSKYRAKSLLEKPKYYAADLAVIPQPGGPIPAPAVPGQPQPAMPPPPTKISFSPEDLKGQNSKGPENAPVTIMEFSDFHCSFCGRVNPTLDQLLKAYPDKIRLVWFHYPLPFHQGADQTAAASECAGDQGKFWEYHGKLFEKTGQFKDDAALISLAKELGLNEGPFKDCLTGGKYKEKVKNNAMKGQAWGVNGTPAFFINGVLLSGAQPYEMFKNAVENALNPGRAPLPTQMAQQQRPPEPPKFVSFNESDLAGKPAQGGKDAPVTIIEFSDFHCPFCGRGSQTMDQVAKNYSGKVRRIFRHFPLPMHQGAEQTHAASECANDQGKFWEYHGKLFEKTGQFKDDASLIGAAKELGLDEGKFKDCLTSGKYKDKVKQEVQAGQNAGVNGTPTFFINGQLISGAMPYESFSKMVDEELAKKK